MDQIDYTAARGYRGVKEASVFIGDLEVKVAVVNGIGNCMDNCYNKAIDEV